MYPIKLMDKPNDYRGYWSIFTVDSNAGMQLLMDLFGEAPPNCDNFVLFSTSGIHGTYETIEEAEVSDEPLVTFIVIAPRIVRIHYGNCKPDSPEDFALLKRLRAQSMAVIAKIGMPEDHQ